MPRLQNIINLLDLELLTEGDYELTPGTGWEVLKWLDARRIKTPDCDPLKIGGKCDNPTCPACTTNTPAPTV